MVDISSQEKKINIKIQSGSVQANVGVTQDTAQYYSEKAREWAISNRIVDNTDYSSKYYAEKSNQSALNAQSFAQSAQDSYKQFQNSVDGALNNVDSAVQGGISEINNTKTDIITDIEFVADGEKKDIQELANNAKDDIKSTGFYMRDDKLYFINSNGEEQEFKSGGGGLEIGDIGIALLGIDETKGLRRYLNGQVIIQDQYAELTTKVKNIIALYPSIVCTEQEWQETATMSAYGACYKFVVDDEAGTIRVPKITGFIQGLTDLASLGDLVKAGLPTLTTNTTGAHTHPVPFTGSNADLGDPGNFLITNAGSSNGSRSLTASSNGSHSHTIQGTADTVQPESGRYPYFIQVATGAEIEANITNEIELNNPFFFGMSQYFEVEPNNLSWLKSAGQYNPKATYPSYYDWLLTEYNNQTTPNVDVIGTPTFNNGIYSNFATANYVRIPKTFTNTSKPWELIIPLKITSYGTMAQYIFCSESYGFGLNVGADGKLQTYISSNGTSWDINSGRVSSATIALNTQYYIKTAWTGTQYVVSVSTDKKSYTTYITVDSTSPIAPSLFKFGTGRGTAGQSLLYGEVNIFEASLTSNGNIWWMGLTSKVKMSTQAYTDYDWVINSADETFRLPISVNNSAQGYLYFYVGETVQNAHLINAGRIEEKLVDMQVDLANTLNKSQITNCLLEVPQRIKLELANGVLTLKAGSEVIVPNGFEADGVTPKFDYVTIESDLSATTGGIAEKLLFYDKTSNVLAHWNKPDCKSGATWSGTEGVLYNSSLNTVKPTNDSGATFPNVYSLPIGVATTNNGFASIDQTFNGIGYIGSTVWVDKGVKGLIPNGRNEDGTLNNIGFTTDNITTVNVVDDVKYFGIKIEDKIKAGVYGENLYDEETNTVRFNNVAYKWMYTGTLTCSSGKITSFNPKLPFRAVDYSDKSEVSGWGMPANKSTKFTLGANGSTYTAPANGYFYVSKVSGIANSFVQIANANARWMTSINHCNGANNWAITWLLVKKGDVIEVTYNATGNTNTFEFIYAEGEK